MFFSTISLVAILAGGAFAQTTEPKAKGSGGGGMFSPDLTSSGTGKYPAHYISVPDLVNHTIFKPKDIPAGVKTPLFLWGNGGCISSGLAMAPILLQFASQGITVFANGPQSPKTFEQTINRNLMADAIDWAEKAKKTPEWSHLDTSRIATGGQSCGGFESLVMAYDKRVTTIGVFNSGFRTGMNTGTIGLPLPNKGKIPTGSEIKVPLFMFMGGKGDVSTASTASEMSTLAPGVPGWAGDYSKNGHMGTYMEKNGGSYGVVGSHWLNWVFFGKNESAKFFKEDEASKIGWLNFQKKNLDKIPVV